MAKRRKKTTRSKKGAGFGMKEWLIIGGAGLIAFFLFRPKAQAGTYIPQTGSGGSTGGSAGGSTGGSAGGSTGGSAGSGSGGGLSAGQYLGANTYKQMFDTGNTNYNYDANLKMNSTYYYEVYILQKILNNNKPIQMSPDLVLDGLFGPNTENALFQLTGKKEIQLKLMFLTYGNPLKNNLNIL